MIAGLADLVGYENTFGTEIDGLLLQLKLRILDGEFNAIVDPRIREIVTAIARQARQDLDVLMNQLAHGGDVRSGGVGAADGVFGGARICLSRLIRIADQKPSWYGDIDFGDQGRTAIHPDGIQWIPGIRG